MAHSGAISILLLMWIAAPMASGQQVPSAEAPSPQNEAERGPADTFPENVVRVTQTAAIGYYTGLDGRMRKQFRISGPDETDHQTVPSAKSPKETAEPIPAMPEPRYVLKSALE